MRSYFMIAGIYIFCYSDASGKGSGWSGRLQLTAEPRRGLPSLALLVGDNRRNMECPRERWTKPTRLESTVEYTSR